MGTKEELQSNFDSFQSEAIVKGKTTIDHNHRVRLGISSDGYVLLDYLSEKKGLYPVADFYQGLYERTGINSIDGYNLLNKLLGKNLIIIVDEKIYASEKFTKWTNQDYDKLFDKFWDLSDISTMKKTRNWPGSKQFALIKFIKVLKSETFEYIMQQRNLYVRYLEDPEREFQRMMVATRWLNPDKKEYAAEYHKFLDIDIEETKPESITIDKLREQYE